jgi:hypothetical protein
MYVTILKHNGRIAKDEIDGTGDETIYIKLSIVVNIECVLVCYDVTIVEG